LEGNRKSSMELDREFKIHECLIENTWSEDDEICENDLTIALWISLNKNLYPDDKYKEIRNYAFYISTEAIGNHYGHVLQLLVPLIACEYYSGPVKPDGKNEVKEI
jgi:hypothetical protein